LTESIDRFVAAKGDAFKPRAYAIGQTPCKPIQKPPSDFGRHKAQGPTSKPGTVAPKSATDITTTPRKQITCYECGRLGHVRSSCPTLKKPASPVPHASSKRAAVIESTSNASIMPTAGASREDKPSASSPVSVKVDGATSTDTEQEINRVTVSLTDEIISEHATERPTPLRDIVTYKDASTLSIDDNVDDNVATSVCCPLAQLSTLTYIDVTVRCSEDSPDITVRALLSDTAAQVSIIRAELLDGSEMEVIGRMRLQPFCGNAVEADWIKLQISPFTVVHDNTFITIDCAVVSNCNENMILTTDVLSRIAQCERAMKVPCNNASQSVCTSDSVNELNVSTNIVDADVLLNDDVIDDSESVDCNRDDECDDVGDSNQNAD